MTELIHEPSGRVLGIAVRCDSLGQRLVGIRGKKSGPGRFWGIPDIWVHSLGMKEPIELAFCDGAGCVLHLRTLLPNRISPPIFRARWIWESAPGGFFGVCVGDVLRCA